MTKLELHTKDPGKFADEVLKHLDIEAEIEPMHEAPEHIRKGSCRNWSILAAAYPVNEALMGDQIVFSNMDHHSWIRAIYVRNVNEGNEPGVNIVVTYIEQVTGEEREFTVNEWSDKPRTFQSVAKENDTVDDGLVRNYPSELRRFYEALKREEETVTALRNFINDCTR